MKEVFPRIRALYRGHPLCQRKARVGHPPSRKGSRFATKVRDSNIFQLGGGLLKRIWKSLHCLSSTWVEGLLGTLFSEKNPSRREGAFLLFSRANSKGPVEGDEIEGITRGMFGGGRYQRRLIRKGKKKGEMREEFARKNLSLEIKCSSGPGSEDGFHPLGGETKASSGPSTERNYQKKGQKDTESRCSLECGGGPGKEKTSRGEEGSLSRISVNKQARFGGGKI